MVYGGTDTEEIQLNEETFWSGSPHNNNSPEAKAQLPYVRQLIYDGKEDQAHAIIDKTFFKGPHGMKYLPLGSLKLKLEHKDVSDYHRELDLSTALVTTSYKYNGVKYERTVFASQADKVIVVQLKAGKKKALSFDLSFDSPLPSKVVPVIAKGDRQVNMMTAIVDGADHEGIKAGLKAQCKVLIEADGEVELEGEAISVEDATTATLYITAATNFVNYNDISGNPVEKINHAFAGIQGKRFCANFQTLDMRNRTF